MGLRGEAPDELCLLLLGLPAEHHRGCHKLGLGHHLRTLTPSWRRRDAVLPSPDVPATKEPPGMEMPREMHGVGVQIRVDGRGFYFFLPKSSFFHTLWLSLSLL